MTLPATVRKPIYGRYPASYRRAEKVLPALHRNVGIAASYAGLWP